MGKSCDFSAKRKSLMKILKRITENLENSPSCRVKPYAHAPCFPMRTCLPCGPSKCKCKLVENCSNTSSYSTSKCGPFPDSCIDVSPSQKYGPVSYTPIVSKCSLLTPCCHFHNGVRCCKQFKRPCLKKYCRIPQIGSSGNYCCAPNIPSCCVYSKRCCFPSCKRKYRYNLGCCCGKPPCPQCNFETPNLKYKRTLEGNLCFGCNTIFLPRCSSDTVLVTPKRGKPLTCSKSVELRGSKLCRGCDCDKRNGLQDRCMRYCCINNPQCRTAPASCHCSKYSCGKHLSIRYGKKKNKSYTCYICGPPTYPFMPCYPKICCCQRCCQKKRDTECQCSPSKCEVECCCEPYPELCSSSPMPCLSNPEPSPEACCHSRSSPEPCVPCREPCEETCVSYIEPASIPCDCINSCPCDEGTQKVEENCICYFENYPSRCISCEAQHF